MGNNMTKIDSTKLTAQENYSGVNLAYLSIKLAHMELGAIQEILRSRKDFALSDVIREVRSALEAGYSYRMGSIESESPST